MDYLVNLINLLQAIGRHTLRLALLARQVVLSVVNRILDDYDALWSKPLYTSKLVQATVEVCLLRRIGAFRKSP
jgi:hypothetical protein